MENNAFYNLQDKEDLKKLYKYLTSYFIKIKSKESREDAIQETILELLSLNKPIVNFYEDIKALQSRIKSRIERADRKLLLDDNIELNTEQDKIIQMPQSGSLIIECAICRKKVKKFISKIKNVSYVFCSNRCRSKYYHPNHNPNEDI